MAVTSVPLFKTESFLLRFAVINNVSFHTLKYKGIEGIVLSLINLFQFLLRLKLVCPQCILLRSGATIFQPNCNSVSESVIVL